MPALLLASLRDLSGEDRGREDRLGNDGDAEDGLHRHRRRVDDACIEQVLVRVRRVPDKA